MPLDVISPAVPTVGTAKLVSSVAIVVLKCTCVEQMIITGQMGLPLECPFCKKVWFVQAKMQINVMEVLADINKIKADRN